MSWKGVIKVGAVFVLGVGTEALKEYPKDHAKHQLNKHVGKPAGEKEQPDNTTFNAATAEEQD